MIRVKDFAKLEQSQFHGNNDQHEVDENETKTESENCPKLPVDIEIISLSSNEDIASAPAPAPAPPPSSTSKQSVSRTPAKRKTKRLNYGASTPSTRTPKLPSTYKFHKISEYFSASKKTECMPSISEKMSSVKSCTADATNNNGDTTTERLENNPSEVSDVKRYKSNLRQAKVVLRRLSIEKPVETVRKRKIQEDQSKLPEFIEYEPTGSTYFQTYEQSTYQELQKPREPTITGNPVNENDVSSEKRVKFELNQNHSDDSNALSGVFKIENNASDIDREAATSNDSIRNGLQIDIVNNNDGNDDGIGGSKNGSNSSNGDNIESKSEPSGGKASKPMTKNTKKGKRTTKKVTAKTLLAKATKTAAVATATRKKKTECPHYKIIEDTKLAVDAFRYGDIEGVEHYFLSHFHADHYIGLKKSFNHKLYVSKITGRLVVELIKVNEQYIQCLDINIPIIVDGVEVIAIDANHCPGAVMFIFKLKTGKCILHTGDFRASPEMEEYPEFWNNDIDTIYLDTTYLSSKYDFFTQSDGITVTLQYCREFVKSCTSSSSKHLIICGAYKVGKEKVWLRIAQDFNYKVWIDDERHKVMQCIQNDEINAVLTRHAKDANIHVLPLGSISYQFIVEYVGQFGETFSKVLAIRPSGWEKKASKPNFANRISILGIQYSEHSSYNELERFVRFLRPKKVISTVPFSSQNMLRTPKVPDSWLNPKIEPKSQSYQRNIMDYMVKKSETGRMESLSAQHVNGMVSIPAAMTMKHATDTITAKREYSNLPLEIIDSISISDTSDDYMP